MLTGVIAMQANFGVAVGLYVVAPVALAVMVGQFVINYTQEQDLQEQIRIQQIFEAKIIASYLKETGRSLEEDMEDWEEIDFDSPESFGGAETINFFGKNLLEEWKKIKLPWRLFGMLILFFLFLFLRRRKRDTK